MDLDKTCLICFKTTSRSLSHIKRIHNLTKEEYTSQFVEYSQHIRQKEEERIKNMKIAAQNRVKQGDHPFFRKEVIEHNRQKVLEWHANKTDEYYAEQRRRAQIAREAKGKNYRHSPETIEKMKGPRDHVKGTPKTEEHKRKLSLSAKNRERRPHKPETIEKMKQYWFDLKQDTGRFQDYSSKLSQAIKNNPVAIENLRKRNIARIISGNFQKKKDTKPELKMKDFLTLNNINFVHQFVITNEVPPGVGDWLFDFYLPDLNMIVEVDGEYWHSKSKEQINKDILKTIITEKAGFNFCRISDADFKPEVILKSIEEITENNVYIIKKRIDKFS